MAAVLRCKLKKVLQAKGMTQLQLRDLSKIRQAYISELCNNHMTTFNRENVAAIMVALNVTDMNEMFELVDIAETPRS